MVELAGCVSLHGVLQMYQQRRARRLPRCRRCRCCWPRRGCCGRRLRLQWRRRRRGRLRRRHRLRRLPCAHRCKNVCCYAGGCWPVEGLYLLLLVLLLALLLLLLLRSLWEGGSAVRLVCGRGIAGRQCQRTPATTAGWSAAQSNASNPVGAQAYLARNKPISTFRPTNQSLRIAHEQHPPPHLPAPPLHLAGCW